MHAMLVLTRKVGEEIVLPSLGVTISLQQIRRAAVSLGFRAPSNVKIMRSELLERCQACQATTSNHQPADLAAASPSANASSNAAPTMVSCLAERAKAP